MQKFWQVNSNTEIATSTDIADLDALKQIHTDTNEPTGFIREQPNTMWIMEVSPDWTLIYRIDQNWAYSENTSWNFANWTDYETVASARWYAMYPVAGQPSYDVYIEWVKHNITTLQQVTFEDVSWSQFVYHDLDWTLKTDTVFDFDFFEDKPITALVYWNTAAQELVVFWDERHWVTMDWFTHRYLHFTQWAQYVSWMWIDWLADWWTTYAQINSWTWYDEDIFLSPSNQTDAQFWWKQWSDWRTVPDTNLIWYTESWDAYVSWNEEVAAWDWALTELTTNDYITMHFILTNNKVSPYVKVLWEKVYNNVADARNWILDEIASLNLWWLPTPEMIFIGSMIINRDWELQLMEDWSTYLDLRKTKVTAAWWTSWTVTTHADTTLRDAADSHPATAISSDVTNFNWILSWTDTDVQTSLETIDDITTANVPASTDKNYVTDAEAVVIWNTSWTNTGDQDLSTYATKTWTETLTNKTLWTTDMTWNLAMWGHSISNVADISATWSVNSGSVATWTLTVDWNAISWVNSWDQDLSWLNVKANNLSDVTDQQTALNNISNVSAATDEYVLTKDTTTWDLIFKEAAAWWASAINDLTDVVIASAADWEVLAYDSASWEWKNAASWGWWASFTWVNWQTVVIAWEIIDWTLWELSAFADWTFAEFQVSVNTLSSWDLVFNIEQNWTVVWTATIASDATATNWRYYATSTDLTDAFAANDSVVIKMTNSWNWWTDLILNLK